MKKPLRRRLLQNHGRHGRYGKLPCFFRPAKAFFAQAPAGEERRRAALSEKTDPPSAYGRRIILLFFLRERAEAGVLALEDEAAGLDRTVTVLCHDRFAFGARGLVVDGGAVQQDDHICVLLD